jgi:uncharacterized membrane protein YdcZ (DUF606 family)
MNRRELWPLLGGGALGAAMLTSTAGAAPAVAAPDGTFDML